MTHVDENLYLARLLNRINSVPTRGSRVAGLPPALKLSDIYVERGAHAIYDLRSHDRQSLVESLDRHELVMLLGAPGSGKSSALRMAAISAAAIGFDGAAVIPVLVDFSDFVDDLKVRVRSILDFVEEVSGAVARDAIVAGRALVLVDNIDPAGHDERMAEAALTKLEEFVADTHAYESRFVGAAPSDGYSRFRLSVVGLVELELRPFSDEDVVRYLAKLSHAIAREHGELVSRDLVASLRAVPVLSEVARLPRYLALIGLELWTSQGTQFSSLTVFRRISEQALKIDLRRAVRKLAWEEVALQVSEGETSSATDEQAPPLHADLQRCPMVLAPQSDGGFAFRHAAIRDFLAAEEFVDSTGTGDGRKALLESALGSSGSWDFGIFALMMLAETSQLKLVNDVVVALTSREGGEVAAARCAAELRDAGIEVPMDGGVASRLVAVLADDLEPVSVREKVEAGAALGKFGDPRRVLDPLEGEFCFVPSGEFEASSSGEATFYGEDVWIGRFPVTNGQFSVFCSSPDARDPKYWTAAGLEWLEDVGLIDPGFSGEPFSIANHPVVGVTWYEASAYCRWLSEQAHSSGALDSSVRVCLLTELEWIRCARGSREVPARPVVRALDSIFWDGASVAMVANPSPRRAMAWGNALDRPTATIAAGLNATCAVGSFPSTTSPYGVEDLNGLVWEWLETLWGPNWETATFPLLGDDADGRNDPETDVLARMVKGGSFLVGIDGSTQESERHLRIDYRARNFPDIRHATHGFRVAIRAASH